MDAALDGLKKLFPSARDRVDLLRVLDKAAAFPCCGVPTKGAARRKCDKRGACCVYCAAERILQGMRRRGLIEIREET